MGCREERKETKRRAKKGGRDKGEGGGWREVTRQKV